MSEQQQQVVEWLYKNAQAGNWRVVIGAALSAVVWFLRVGIFRPTVDRIPFIGKFSKWFKTDRGGVALTIAVGVFGGIGTAFAGSRAVTVPLILSGIINGIIGAGVFNVSKRALSPSDKKDPPKDDSTAAPTAAIRIPLELLLLIPLVGGCAHGEFMFRYDQATLTGAIGAMACKDTLSDANDASVAACRKILTAGDPINSQKCLDAWDSSYKTSNTACRALKDATKTAVAGREVVAAAANGNLLSIATIAKLAQAGADVAAIFLKNGISLGGK